MIANELRIGNWVAKKVYGAKPDALLRKVDADYIKWVADGYAECFGIPLTPEILEKCGFEKEGRIFYKGLFFVLFAQNNCGFGVKNTGVISSFKYLHQLQNIMLDLTREELQIKDL